MGRDDEKKMRLSLSSCNDGRHAHPMFPPSAIFVSLRFLSFVMIMI